jgi:hypothetical protein
MSPFRIFKPGKFAAAISCVMFIVALKIHTGCPIHFALISVHTVKEPLQPSLRSLTVAKIR